MAPTAIVDCQCTLGEGPIWHPDERVLYWCDIVAGRLHRFDPETETHEVVYEGVVLGAVTVQTDGSLLLFGEEGVVRRWDDGDVDVVLEGIPGEEESRFNDVVADPVGRVFCGTMPSEDRGGRLYRLDTDGSVTELLDDLEIPNGMGFSPDEGTMYFVESGPEAVYAFDYDADTGELSNQRVFLDTTDESGVPDGLTVDEEGHIWTARWDGSAILRYTPDGRQVDRFEFPVTKVTSMAFGGSDYEDLYVTTAGDGPEWDGPAERAGELFHLAPGVAGTSEYRSDVTT